MTNAESGYVWKVRILDENGDWDGSWHYCKSKEEAISLAEKQGDSFVVKKLGEEVEQVEIGKLRKD